MATFRLVHASDLHVATSPNRASPIDVVRGGFRHWVNWYSSHNPAKLEALAKFVYDRRHAIDRVVITGDLSTSGRPDDLALAHEFVDTPADHHYWYVDRASGDLRPTLRNEKFADEPSAILVLPGNHDRYRFPYYWPGGIEFDRVFRRYWAVGQSAMTVAVLETPSDSANRLALVAADLTLRSRDRGAGLVGFVGQGRAETHLVDALRVLTTDVRSKMACEVLWLVHFPPKFPKGHAELALIDDDAIVEAAEELAVPAILAGHTHRAVDYKTGTARVITVGTTTQAVVVTPEDSSLNLVTVNVQRGRCSVTTTCFRWDESLQEFV